MPLAAVLVLGGWALWQSRTATETVAAAAPTTQVVTVGTGTMSRTVSAEGTVAMAESEDLSFTAAGTVTAVNVTAGQQVKAGDVLATIESAELTAAVADAETKVAEASATLSADYTAGASYAQITADQAALTTAEDRLAAANEDLAGAQLVATFDGTVATVDLTVGEELGSGGSGATTQTGSGSGSGQSAGTLGSASTGTLGQGATGAAGTTGAATTGTAQIQVVSTSTYVVELGLDDTDIAEVAVGQPATIALSTATSSSSAFPGGFGGFPGGMAGGAGGMVPPGAATANPSTATDDQAADGEDDAATSAPTRRDVADVTGTVTEVGLVADASTGVATYPVTVTFDDTSGDFNAGATVQVDITYAEVTDVVQVPALAVTSSGGTSTVTVRADGTEEARTVTTGLSSGTMVEITSGLAEGDQVVVTMRGPGGMTGGGGQVPTGQMPTGQMPGGALPPGVGTGAAPAAASSDAEAVGTDG